jgi:hypothetical protein
VVEVIVGGIFMLLQDAIGQTVTHTSNLVHQASFLNFRIIAIDLPVTKTIVLAVRG